MHIAGDDVEQDDRNDRSAAGPATAGYDCQRSVEPSGRRLVLGRCCGWASRAPVIGYGIPK